MRKQTKAKNNKTKRTNMTLLTIKCTSRPPNQKLIMFAVLHLFWTSTYW